MRLHILSDLHLDASNLHFEFPASDAIILAGDIAVSQDLLLSFIDRLPCDRPSFYILGNHEHEGHRIDLASSFYRELLKPWPHVHLLDQSSFVYRNVAFIGATLWSNLSNPLAQDTHDLEQRIHQFHEFKTISTPDGPWSCSRMKSLSYRHHSFIQHALDEHASCSKRVVITHFAPSRRSIHPRFSHDALSCFWANHYPDLLGRSDLHIHGHTHDSFDYFESDTRVVCNPRGYSNLYNLSPNPHFNPLFIVDL